MRRDGSVDLLLLLYLIAALALMVLIFYMSSMPGAESQAESDSILMPILEMLKYNATDEEVEFLLFILRKSAHFGLYLLLGGFLELAVSRQHLNAWNSVNMWMPISRLLFPWIVAVIYAASDEFHQSMVLERSSEIRDIMIDGAGALVGVLLFGWIFVCAHKEDRY